MSDQQWTAGQRVALYGNHGVIIAVVDRVTPSGLPVVNETIYRKNGHSRGNDPWRTPWIKLLTPDLEAEVAAEIRHTAAWRRWCDVKGKIGSGTLTTEQLNTLSGIVETALKARAAP